VIKWCYTGIDSFRPENYRKIHDTIQHYNHAHQTFSGIGMKIFFFCSVLVSRYIYGIFPHTALFRSIFLSITLCCTKELCLYDRENVHVFIKHKNKQTSTADIFDLYSCSQYYTSIQCYVTSGTVLIWSSSWSKW